MFGLPHGLLPPLLHRVLQNLLEGGQQCFLVLGFLIPEYVHFSIAFDSDSVGDVCQNATQSGDTTRGKSAHLQCREDR